MHLTTVFAMRVHLHYTYELKLLLGDEKCYCKEKNVLFLFNYIKWPSIKTESVIEVSAVKGIITNGPVPGITNLITSFPGLVLEQTNASLKDPGPLSFVLVTKQGHSREVICMVSERAEHPFAVMASRV